MDAISGVYRIDFDHDESLFYIGSTKDMRDRWHRHIYELRRGKHTNEIMNRIYAKYGLGDFTFYVIEVCELDKLIEREQYYIDTLKPTVNMCNIAGTSLGVKRSDSWREKQLKRFEGKEHPIHSEESKRRAQEWHKYRSMKGENNPMYGKKIPKETIEKIRRKNTGRKQSTEERNKRSLAMKKRWENASEEVKEKFRRLMRGNTIRKGQRPSEETRRKMSESQKERYAKRKLQQAAQ